MLTAPSLRYCLTLFLVLLVSVAVAPAEAVKRALLVGVGDYADGRVSDLKGPPYDVAVLRDSLVRHGGFDDGNITVLLDGEATRSGILAAIEALGSVSRAGDFVLIYLTGHGTSAFDPGLRLPLPHHSGAFVPVDFAAAGSRTEMLDSLVIGARDLRPLLQVVDNKGVRGLILIDSCYSQYSSRLFVPPKWAFYRTLSGSLTAGLEDAGFDADYSTAEDTPAYPYRHLVTLTASSKKEKAIDVTDPRRTLDGKPHGAFTDSLLRTLRHMGGADANHDGVVSNSELFAAVRARMSAARYPHSPQMLPLRSEYNDAADLLNQAAFAAPQQPEAAEPVSEFGEPLRVDVGETLQQLVSFVRDDDGFMLASESADLRVVPGGRVIRLLTAVGDLVFTGDNEADMIHALRQQRWVQQLLLTPNAAQRFQIDVRMDGNSGETFEAGERLGFSTSMDQSAYLLLVDAAPNGNLQVLYPFNEGELAIVPGGQPKHIGDICVGPPFGIDHVVAAGFVTRPPLYGRRLLEGGSKAFSPGDAEHRELMAMLQATDEPNMARQVIRVVTVPGEQPGSRSCY